MKEGIEGGREKKVGRKERKKGANSSALSQEITFRSRQEDCKARQKSQDQGPCQETLIRRFRTGRDLRD